MNWTQPDITWAPLTPILIVLLAGAVGILVEAFVRTPATRRLVQFGLTLAALVGALAAAIVLWATQEGSGTVVLRLMLVVDRQSLAWQVLLAVFGILAALLFAARTRTGEEEFTPLGSSTPGALDETRALRAGLQVTEVFPLLLFAVGGMMLFTAVTDFVFLFVVLELFSLPLYILVALARRRRALSHEAALKYFLLGAFSSAIYIFGVALLFGATTQTSFTAVQRAIEIIAGHDPLIIAAAVLILVGLFFKLGAVPFHSWVPDVYQGAPTAVTGFMAAATKGVYTASMLQAVTAPQAPGAGLPAGSSSSSSAPADAAAVGGGLSGGGAASVGAGLGAGDRAVQRGPRARGHGSAGAAGRRAPRGARAAGPGSGCTARVARGGAGVRRCAV